MLRIIVPVLAVLGLGAVAVPAAAHDLHINTDQCNYSTDYDVTVTPAGVRFQRADGTPSKVFMRDGHLRVDGRAVAVSHADEQSLRQYETQVRKALPEMAGIAREGVDIGFSAMTTVAATFSSEDQQRDRLLQRLNRQHADALRRIDATLGQGQWRHDALKDAVENTVQHAVPELVSTVAAGAVKAALSGDDSQVAALQARADSLDTSIEREVDARADKLKVRADGLCKRLVAMDQMQKQWQFRLGNGQPLQLLQQDKSHASHEHAHKDKDDVAATR